MRQVLVQGLQEENHSVTLARDGLAALAALDTGSFDALVLEVMMPGLTDGICVRANTPLRKR